MNSKKTSNIIGLAAFLLSACSPAEQSENQPVGERPASIADSGTSLPMNPMTQADAGTSPETKADAGMETLPPVVDPADLERAYRWLNGKFNSQLQAMQNSSFYEVQLHSCTVLAPELGDRILYVEQAIMSNLSAPYRQRLYVVKQLDDGRVESAVYSLTNPDQAQGLCDRSELIEFEPGDYQVRQGCSVFLDRKDDHFIGGTNDKDCQSTMNGASYATAEVQLYADQILSLDRGYDGNDTQVWGATSAYEFLRQDATPPTMPPTNPPGTTVGGETCQNAPTLESVSQAIAMPTGNFTHRLQTGFGTSDDYNPLDSSGKQPGCSLVYDAFGKDVVFKVTLQPGETLHTRFAVPYEVSGGIYFLDGCSATPSWPDVDQSGMCGRNEYASHGYCAYTTCDPIDWSFEWPMILDGMPTQPKDFYLVIDEVGANTGAEFILSWWLQKP